MKQTPLANAELAVMELLWDENQMTARQIRERLYPNATKAQHGTVQRLLQRLEDKGYVERDTTQPVLFFSAAVSRQEYAGSQLESLAAKLTGGSLAPLIDASLRSTRDLELPRIPSANKGLTFKNRHRIDSSATSEGGVLITHFIEQKKISRDDIEQLRAILDEQQDQGEQP